jgi:hypothetical protein
MDLIDWFFYWIGRGVLLACAKLGIKPELGDAATAVLGFVAAAGFIALAFVAWGVFFLDRA